MQQSWLLCYSLLLVVATREALTYSDGIKPDPTVASSTFGQKPPVENMLPNVVIHKVGGDTEFEELMGGTTNPTTVPVERVAAALQIPRPTAIPLLRHRQDDGQIQALSAQLQSLSQSATEAISSVSSSASSALSQMSQSARLVRQSADQAVQSATQAADQANRQLSQTQSSASSAVSAANARASDQLSQSLVSMSSRIASNLASAQSSASDAVSSARAAASQFAASQIQAFKADASGANGDAGSFVEPPQPNPLSTPNLAIIVTVSILGTAVLSTASSCLLLRYRRKRRSSREGELPPNNKIFYNKPIAVRGSLSPRFPRFGRSSRSPTDDFKLPSLSPLVRSKKAQREARSNMSFADSDYIAREEEDGGAGHLASNVGNKSSADMQLLPFRLQKSNGVSSATAVRLIRVGSEKGKSGSSTEFQQAAVEPMPLPPVLTASNQSPKTASISTPNRQTMPAPLQANNAVTQLQKAEEPSVENRRASIRSTHNPRTETSARRPPIRLTAASQNRFRFRDSSDMESEEPTPTNMDMASPLNSNARNVGVTRSADTQVRVNGSGSSLSRAVSFGQPKNAGGTFATFPMARNEPTRESMINRGRPKPARLRGEGERRPGEPAGADGRNNRIGTRSSRDMFNSR